MRNQNGLIAKIYRGLILAMFVGIILGERVDAQNIQTNSTGTTLGSTSFGFVITPTELGRVMQAATEPNCVTVSVNARNCTSNGPDGLSGTQDDYAKRPGNPGSFTHNPFKTVDSDPDVGWFSAFPQTAPLGANTLSTPSVPNTLTGALVTNINLGTGTKSGDPFHSAGHIRFVLTNPQTGAGATIDQLIQQEINVSGGLIINFTERDITNTPFTTTPSPLTIADGPGFGGVSFSPGSGFSNGVNLTAQLQLQQSGERGLLVENPFTLDYSVLFPYNAIWFAPLLGCGGPPPCTGAGLDRPTQFPPDEAFITPGLNTGGSNPNAFPNVN